MAYTTVEAVKLLIGSDFISEQEVSNDQINSAVADASSQVDIDGLPSQQKERATRLYSCHLLTITAQSWNTSVENVASEKVGPLQTTYKNYSGNNKYSDRYEEQYDKLLESLGLGGNMGQFF